MEDLSNNAPACEIERLPDEVLLIVWKYLSARDVLAASRVCQRWEQLSANRALLVRRRSDVQRARPSLRILFVTARFTKPMDLLLVTRNLHTLITHERVPLNEDHVKLLSEFPHLRHLDIFTEQKNYNTLVENLSAVYRQLNTLVLNEPVVHPDIWQNLVKSSNLTQLHMYGRIWLYPPGAIPLLLASRREQFTELTLRCKEISENGYLAISRCPNLVVLRLCTHGANQFSAAANQSTSNTNRRTSTRGNILY
ncbi:f-box-like domain-containing protein [Phthorimaea operculella]|nr:f-box-like domain-containing protein [Phthorimaea operculella]